MIEEIRKIRSSKRNLRNFGLSVGFICIAIAGVLLWKEKEAFLHLLAIGLVLVGCGTALPMVLKPVYLVWMGLAAALGWIMTRLILSLLFYLVITPIALVAKLIGKRFIELKWDANQPTYWNDLTSTGSTREGYRRQF